MIMVSISDFLILDVWLPGKVRHMTKGTDHCRVWERKEWLLKLAVPEHCLGWTFLKRECSLVICRRHGTSEEQRRESRCKRGSKAFFDGGVVQVALSFLARVTGGETGSGFPAGSKQS